jgi:arylsulfatase A-like enzyme
MTGLPTRPPILFLIVDCLRSDRAFAQAKLSPEGLFGRAVRSGRSYANAVAVTPTTTPAVTSMLTGLYPFEHGLRGLLGFRLPADVPTIASALSKAGYRTECDVTGPLLPQLRLFDEFDEYVHVDGKQATVHGDRGDGLVRRLRELRTRPDPWFLVFHVWDLHEPRLIPDGFRGRALSRSVYDRALAALDSRLGYLLTDELLDGVVVCLVGDHGENLRFEPRGKLGTGIAALLWWDATRWAMQPITERVIAYGARSSSKRVLRLAPRALITHGHHLFEPLVRVPYILLGPGIPPGTSHALVAHVDVAPTFGVIAGTWFPGGVGALPLPLDGEGDPERCIVLETAWVTAIAGVRQVGLRTRRWKYMELDTGDAPALFDLEQDPAERRNVATRHPRVASQLRDELRSMLAGARVETGETEMSSEETAVVERRLRDLGYLE